MPTISFPAALGRRELPHIHRDPTNPLGYTEDVFNCVMFSISCFVVFLRLLARHKIRSFGKDDFFILCALLIFALYCSCGIASHKIYSGGGTSASFSATESYLYLLIVAEVSYCWTMIFLKLSLGYFFLRLLVTPGQRRTVYTVMYLSVVTNLVASFWEIFEHCAPRKLQIAVGYVQAALNTITDVTLAVVPFWLLNNSMLPRNLKIYVIGILGLATIGCVASFVRFNYIMDLFNVVDFTKSVESLSISSLVELGTGIVASSLATLRPLISGSLASMTSKLSGALSSFGSTPKRSAQPTPFGNSLTASSALRTEYSTKSLVQTEARYAKRPPVTPDVSQDELVRDEVIFSPDATHMSFLTDESDHDVPWNSSYPRSREPPIQEVELAHITGPQNYTMWRP